MPAVILAIVALLVLVWAGVEVDRVVTAHPAETIFTVSSVAVIVVSAAVARLHASNKPVPLNPPARGTVIEAAPVRPAIRPTPADAPVKPPPLPVIKFEDRCDGPRCQEKLPDDPWRSEGTFPDGHTVSGRFHSKECTEAWQQMMAERHAGHSSQ